MTTVSGKGIHSGLTSRVVLRRSGEPVAFIRGRTRIPAVVDNVRKVSRATVLGRDGEEVAMVEHLLAALHARGWWEGLDIEVYGSELPVLDGSASGWLEPIDALGPPPGPPDAFRLESPLEVRAGSGVARAEPGRARLSVDIDFDHPAIGHQSWSGGPAEYSQLLDARTFGFLHEKERLVAAGLALGADLDNTVVFGEAGPLAPLRGPDEPVRHKALDALGDLYLFGRPLEASIRLTRASHGLHATLVSSLRKAEATRRLVS